MKRLRDGMSRCCAALWSYTEPINPLWLPDELWCAIRHIALMARHWTLWQRLWAMARHYGIERWRPGATQIEFRPCNGFCHNPLMLVTDVNSLLWSTKGVLFGAKVCYRQLVFKDDTCTTDGKKLSLALINGECDLMNSELPLRIMLQFMPAATGQEEQRLNVRFDEDCDFGV